jgi:hypothetical protein
MTAFGSCGSFGGISRSGSLCLIAVSSKLFAASPGTTAGPVSPPLRMPCFVSSISPPFDLPDFGGVAFVAVLHEHRTDLRFKEGCVGAVKAASHEQK